MHAIVGLTALNIGLNAHSNTKRSDARNMESNLDEESNRYTHQRYLLKRTRDTRWITASKLMARQRQAQYKFTAFLSLFCVVNRCTPKLHAHINISTEQETTPFFIIPNTQSLGSSPVRAQAAAGLRSGANESSASDNANFGHVIVFAKHAIIRSVAVQSYSRKSVF
jgi:hypothetical protein